MKSAPIARLIALMFGAMLTVGCESEEEEERRWKAEDAPQNRASELVRLKADLARLKGGPGELKQPEGCQLLTRARAGLHLTQIGTRGFWEIPITYEEVGVSEADLKNLRHDVNLRAGKAILAFIMSPGTGPACGGNRSNLADPFEAAERLAGVMREVNADAAAIGTTRAAIRTSLIAHARTEVPRIKRDLRDGDEERARLRLKTFFGFGIRPSELGLGVSDLARYASIPSMRTGVKTPTPLDSL